MAREEEAKKTAAGLGTQEQNILSSIQIISKIKQQEMKDMTLEFKKRIKNNELEVSISK